MSKDKFEFAISLSVLNHLGRNLYRNFVTVLGEAVSNAWDADAKEVFIYIDLSKDRFVIKDSGDGMSADDFQNKFLKIGYSKRSEFGRTSKSGRPFIGAKGIGKLAMLSCADKVSIFTKKESNSIISGFIDNTELDKAIKDQLVPGEYEVNSADESLISDYIDGFKNGTIIVFEGLRENMRSSDQFIRKIIALSFRFSLIDENFSIYVNGVRVGMEDVSDLRDGTQLLWKVNGFNDEFTSALNKLALPAIEIETKHPLKGFIATVKTPKLLKIRGIGERATLDLFVNGRLREKNILKHIPTQRIVESYIYGHIHFDILDIDESDPFTSSREGVIENNEKFKALLDYLKKDLLPKVIDQWDLLRDEIGQDGDDENARKSKKQRKARALYNASREEFNPQPSSPGADEVEQWLNELRDDAEFNISAYADCFLSENLLRKYIQNKGMPKIRGITKEAQEWKTKEEKNKEAANISFSIRTEEDDRFYLGMDALAVAVEGPDSKMKPRSLSKDAIRYKPIRNAVGHTGRLTDIARRDLEGTFNNIKARLRTLLKIGPNPPAP